MKADKRHYHFFSAYRSVTFTVGNLFYFQRSGTLKLPC